MVNENRLFVRKWSFGLLSIIDKYSVHSVVFMILVWTCDVIEMAKKLPTFRTSFSAPFLVTLRHSELVFFLPLIPSQKSILEVISEPLESHFSKWQLKINYLSVLFGFYLPFSGYQKFTSTLDAVEYKLYCRLFVSCCVHSASWNRFLKKWN